MSKGQQNLRQLEALVEAHAKRLEGVEAAIKKLQEEMQNGPSSDGSFFGWDAFSWLPSPPTTQECFDDKETEEWEKFLPTIK